MPAQTILKCPITGKRHDLPHEDKGWETVQETPDAEEAPLAAGYATIQILVRKARTSEQIKAARDAARAEVEPAIRAEPNMKGKKPEEIEAAIKAGVDNVMSNALAENADPALLDQLGLPPAEWVDSHTLRHVSDAGLAAIRDALNKAGVLPAGMEIPR